MNCLEIWILVLPIGNEWFKILRSIPFLGDLLIHLTFNIIKETTACTGREWKLLVLVRHPAGFSAMYFAIKVFVWGPSIIWLHVTYPCGGWIFFLVFGKKVDGNCWTRRKKVFILLLGVAVTFVQDQAAPIYQLSPHFLCVWMVRILGAQFYKSIKEDIFEIWIFHNNIPEVDPQLFAGERRTDSILFSTRPFL